ncbi:MAG: hypothetical protein K2Q06_02185, partial [Parvularculaceae bacterium]|nr:hypothetical protein [Parvularculaceae bacterium]
MRLAVLAAAVLVAAHGAGSATAAAPTPAATPELFGALPTTSEVQISPNGSRIAALMNGSSGPQLVVFPLGEAGAKPEGILLGGAKARALLWKDDSTLLVLVSLARTVDVVDGRRPIEFFRWIAVDTKTFKTTRLFDNEQGYFIADPGQLIASLPSDPSEAVFARTSVDGVSAASSQTAIGMMTGADIDKITYALFRVSMANRVRKTEKGEPKTRNWFTDAAGAPFIRID